MYLIILTIITIYLRLKRYDLTLQRQGCDEGQSSLCDDKVQCELFESRAKFMRNLKEIELKGLKEKEAPLKKSLNVLMDRLIEIFRRVELVTIWIIGGGFVSNVRNHADRNNFR